MIIVNRLKNVLGKGQCIEILYYPRRNEIVASIDLSGGMRDRDFFRIYDELKRLGFNEFEIYGGECDLLEGKYNAPEITFYARNVPPELKKALEVSRKLIVCHE